MVLILTGVDRAREEELGLISVGSVLELISVLGPCTAAALPSLLQPFFHLEELSISWGSQGKAGLPWLRCLHHAVTG